MGNRQSAKRTAEDGFGIFSGIFSGNGEPIGDACSERVSSCSGSERGCPSTAPEVSQEQVLPLQQCIGLLRHCERADLTWDRGDSPSNQSWLTPPPRSPSEEWSYDPALSASGRAHATQIGKNLAGETLFKFDAVVSSPYRRCMETAFRICTELQVPLAIDGRLGEIQNASVMGDRLTDFGAFHRSAAENIEFAKAHGVEVIGIEEICGITPSDDLPAWPESVQKGFKRYTKAFELFVNSGKSILCVTHGMGLVSVANTCCDEFDLFQGANPSMGDFFVCNASTPREASKSRRSKYRVITHSCEIRAEQAMRKRSVSCSSTESLADRRSGSCSSVSSLVPIDELSCPDLSPKYRSLLSERRGKLPPLALPIKSKTAYV